MRVIRFRTRVDPGIRVSQNDFRRDVTIYLNDPDGWAQMVSFAYAPTGRAVLIRLCEAHTIQTEGCRDGELSCAILGGDKIWLNADRWLHGAPASKLPLLEYRQYMVSHEMGHILGYDHVRCPGSGPVPIMVQQTRGIGSCEPNTKVTEIDLRSTK